jgi:hypothetical protein
MRKPFLLAVLASLVPSFAVGYIWHLVAFHDVYTRLAIYRPDPMIPFGLGSMLVQGLIFAWAFPRLFDTARDAWAKSALRAGRAIDHPARAARAMTRPEIPCPSWP